MEMINYGRQHIDNLDIEAVKDVLNSEFLTMGPKIEDFEYALTKLTDFNYTVCVNSGTSALHAACWVVGIKQGDEVIVPSMTFVATANAVLHCGGTPVICDINPDTLLIDIDSVKKCITSKTKAIIAVDYAGQQCDYKALKELGITIIADACHSFGMMNKYADYICYSFHPVKHITTGEGGAVQGYNVEDEMKLKAFINNGRYGIMSYHIGYNYKMSDIQAALGLRQLNKYGWMIEERRQIAEKYNFYLSNGNLKQLSIVNKHSYHLFVVKVDDRLDFIPRMYHKGINCAVHYLPLYQHKHLRCDCKNFPNTESIKDNIVSLPIYPGLTEDEQDYVIEVLNDYGSDG